MVCLVVRFRRGVFCIAESEVSRRELTARHLFLPPQNFAEVDCMAIPDFITDLDLSGYRASTAFNNSLDPFLFTAVIANNHMIT